MTQVTKNAILNDSHSLSVTLGDRNCDHQSDVIVANYSTVRIEVFFLEIKMAFHRYK